MPNNTAFVTPKTTERFGKTSYQTTMGLDFEYFTYFSALTQSTTFVKTSVPLSNTLLEIISFDKSCQRAVTDRQGKAMMVIMVMMA